MALIGASGSGKTFSALSIASELGKKILVVDTEHGSASKYADLFEFDVVEPPDFAPEYFILAIDLAAAHDYDVVIIDSLSHAWMGRGGILELHGNAEARTKNNFTAWKDVTPKHQALIEAIVSARCHVIATMRAKTEYAMNQENGRTKVQTVGLAPVQRDGMEYEFDVVAHLDENNNFIVKKTRCPMLSDKIYPKAGANVAEVLKIWLQGEKKTIVRMPEPVAAQLPAAEAVSPSQRIDENQELIGEIKRLLNDLGKNEVDFNTWFQKNYEFDNHWEKAGIAVKREAIGILKGWQRMRAQKQAA